MGCRLHYETRHVIEYSYDTLGNYDHDAIADVLSENNVQTYTEEEFDGYYSDNFHCDKSAIESLVKSLRKLNPDDKACDRGDFFMSNKEVADFFESALKNCEKDSDYIFFSWF